MTDVTPTGLTRDLQRSSRDTKNTVELPALDFVQLSNPMRPEIFSHVEIYQSDVEFPESSSQPLYPRQHLLVSSLIYIHNLLNKRSSKLSTRSVSQAVNLFKINKYRINLFWGLTENSRFNIKIMV